MPNNQIQSLTVNGTTYDIVDNTSGYITADSPALTGTPTAPTPLSGAGDTQIATVKYVQDSMAGAGAGTVTSVRVQATSPVQSSTSTAQSSTLDTTISLADGYGDTKNPYGTKTANYVLAGPSSGSAVVPSFRQLVAADIPDLSDTYLTSSDIADKADKFIVHIGSQISGDYYQIGETYEQILSAASSGSQLVAVDIDMTYPYLGVANMGGAIVIGFGFSATYNGTAILNGYMILENNTAMKIYSSNIIPTKVSDLTNDSGFITSYTETDPVFSASAAAGITGSDITNWNGKTSNTGTVTSVGISNATDGGLSVSGSPITSSGTISVGHSNVLASAQTTSGIYPIKIDKNGHISEYGSAVTIPTITLNGSATTSPSFYAPTTAGTSGQILTSNGSGAPTWSAAPSSSSYTATSPIDITGNDISHEDSGVTAGTYDGGGVKSTGFYVPSITVDAKGHVTSATDLGNLIPINTYNSSDPVYGMLLATSSWALATRSYSSYPSVLAAGNTSKTITISSDSNSAYTYKNYFRVVDVEAFDAVTKEPVIVDWSASALYSNNSSVTVTVSIASAHTNNIWLYVLLSIGYGSM